MFLPIQAWSDSGGYGLLWLEIDPANAKIVLDGRFLDVDVWLLSVPPGSHEIMVHKPGFKNFSQDFDIVSSQSLHLRIRLESETQNPSRVD